MPRLRERGSARGGFCRSIRVASAFSPRRSTGHPSFYGLLLSQRERQGDWFRARSPTSAYPSVAAVRPCRTDVLPRERGVETPIFASPVAEAVVGRERGSDRGAPGSRAHQDLPPPQRVANSRGTRGRAASRTFGRCNATRPTRTYGGVSYGARRSFAHVPLASPQASPRSGVLLDKGGSPGGRTYTPSFRRERGEPPTFHEVSSTTSTGGWSASSSRFPITRSVLWSSGIVSLRPQLGTALARVGGSAAAPSTVSSLKRESSHRPCPPIRLGPDGTPENKPIGERGPGDPGIRQGRPSPGWGRRPGPFL
jgi:hypothetical protein